MGGWVTQMDSFPDGNDYTVHHFAEDSFIEPGWASSILEMGTMGFTLLVNCLVNLRVSDSGS